MLGFRNELEIDGDVVRGFVAFTDYVVSENYERAIILTARQWLNTLDVLNVYGIMGLETDGQGIRLEFLRQSDQRSGITYTLRLANSDYPQFRVQDHELKSWWQSYQAGSFDPTYPSDGPDILVRPVVGKSGS